MCAQCNSTYNTVDGTVIGDRQEVKAVITLGSGNNITAMLNNPDTQIPDNLRLYSGADVNYIPHGLAGSASDLVIYAADGLLMSGLAVTYYDPVADLWVGPIQPQLFLTNGSLNWGCWKNFAQVAVPFKCRITILGAFINAPGSGPDIDNDGVDDKLDADSNNAVSNKVVTEALQEFSQTQQDIKQTQQNIIAGLKEYGVGYTMVELSPEELGIE